MSREDPPADDGPAHEAADDVEAADEELTPAIRIFRGADGSIELHLTLRERQILRATLEDLRSVLDRDWPGRQRRFEQEEDGNVGDPAGHHGPDGIDDPAVDVAAVSPDAIDPVLARLYPDSRPDDPGASRRFRNLVGDDIAEGRISRLAVMDETLDERSIDDQQAEAWLGVLNDLRLVMATRLGVTDDTESEPIAAGDPDAAARIVYAYAGWLEWQLVDALAEALPDVPGDDGPEPA